MFRSSRQTSALILIAFGLAAATSAQADPGTLNGEPVTVTLLETGFDPVSQTFTAGPGGTQILGNALDPVADPVGYDLFASESVDAQALQIVYTIEGGGTGVYAGGAPACSGSPGCSLWGDAPYAPDDARFLFSNLNFGSPGIILENVSLTPNNVFGASVADVTANSFELIFGSAGILNSEMQGQVALGTLTLDLQTEIAPVPLPSSLVMLLGGLLVVVVVGDRRRPYFKSTRS